MFVKHNVQFGMLCHIRKKTLSGGLQILSRTGFGIVAVTKLVIPFKCRKHQVYMTIYPVKYPQNKNYSSAQWL